MIIVGKIMPGKVVGVEVAGAGTSIVAVGVKDGRRAGVSLGSGVSVGVFGGLGVTVGGPLSGVKVPKAVGEAKGVSVRVAVFVGIGVPGVTVGVIVLVGVRVGVRGIVRVRVGFPGSGVLFSGAVSGASVTITPRVPSGVGVGIPR